MGEMDFTTEERTGFLSGVDYMSILLTMGVVLGISLETVVLPLWIDSFNPNVGGPYFILFFASSIFAIFFTILYVSLLFIRGLKSHDPLQLVKTYWIYFFIIGLFNAINGILLVYASNPSRTPPLLQALLVNTVVIWGMITTQIFITKDEGKLNYFQLLPMISLVILILGIVISLIPLISRTISGEVPIFKSGGGVVWSFVFVSGILPAAIFNVFQEKYLKLRSKECKNYGRTEDEYLDTVAMLFWSCWFQLFVMISLFWVDLLPEFGYTPDHKLSSFADNFSNSWKCYFGAYEGCGQVWWHGVIFISGYFLAYFCSAGLNRSSAVYNLIANMLGSPASALFWIVYYQFHTDKHDAEKNTPLWAVLPSLALLLFGSAMWKIWENYEKRRLAELMQSAMDSEYDPIVDNHPKIKTTIQ